MNVTEKELAVLTAIVHNDYNIDEGPVEHEFYSQYINLSERPSGIEGKALAGVVASLNKKGLVQSFGHFGTGEETVMLTQAGYDAVMASK